MLYSDTNIGPLVCKALAENCPKLKTLVMRTGRFRQAELDLLTARCRKLGKLELESFHGKITPNYANLPLLHSLRIVCTDQFDERSVLHNLSNCPALKNVFIYSRNHVWTSTKIVHTIALRCPNLQNVSIGGCYENVRAAFQELQTARVAAGQKFQFTAHVVPEWPIQMSLCKRISQIWHRRFLA